MRRCEYISFILEARGRSRPETHEVQEINKLTAIAAAELNKKQKRFTDETSRQ